MTRRPRKGPGLLARAAVVLATAAAAYLAHHAAHGVLAWWLKPFWGR